MTDAQQKSQFLSELYGQVNGDLSRQASMYAVGSAMGIDRSEAKKAAEQLMGEALIEIRTLAGDIAMTEAGLDYMGLSDDSPEPDCETIPPGGILDRTMVSAVDEAIMFLKSANGGFSLDFDQLTELSVDVRTLVTQLSSPRPKADIVLACLNAIGHLLQGVEGAKATLGRIRQITGAV